MRFDGGGFVAHNASFDARFAHGELTASGNFLGKSIPYLCTMTLAKQYKVDRTAKLSDVTLALGIRNSQAHSALADAIATAQVLEITVAGLAKKTKVLIAGDINSMSGKAKKARDYGIPVISEAAADELIRFTEGGL